MTTKILKVSNYITHFSMHLQRCLYFCISSLYVMLSVNFSIKLCILSHKDVLRDLTGNICRFLLTKLLFHSKVQMCFRLQATVLIYSTFLLMYKKSKTMRHTQSIFMGHPVHAIIWNSFFCIQDWQYISIRKHTKERSLLRIGKLICSKAIT